MERQGHDAPGAHFLRAFLHALAVDADMALINDVLGDGAALHQPDEEQEAVDPHQIVIASEAKQSTWIAASLRSLR